MGKKKNKNAVKEPEPIRVPGSFRFVDEAVDAAKPDDCWIHVSGVHKLTKPLLIDKNIRITGEEGSKLVASHCHGILQRAGALLEVDGLGIETDGTGCCALMLEGGTLTANRLNLSSKAGCVVEVRGTTERWKMEECDLSGSDYGAGLFSFTGEGEMANCRVKRNGGDGVGVAEGAKVTLQGCEITNNGGSGIQIYHSDSRVTMTECVVQENDGGALRLGEGAEESAFLADASTQATM